MAFARLDMMLLQPNSTLTHLKNHLKERIMSKEKIEKMIEEVHQAIEEGDLEYGEELVNELHKIVFGE